MTVRRLRLGAEVEAEVEVEMVSQKGCIACAMVGREEVCWGWRLCQSGYEYHAERMAGLFIGSGMGGKWQCR